MMTSLIDSVDELGGVECDRVMNARRELLGEDVHLGDYAFGDLERVGRGILQNAQAYDLRVTVETQRAVVVLRAELDPRDVAEAHVAAVGIGAQDDVGELLRRRRAASAR